MKVQEFEVSQEAEKLIRSFWAEEEDEWRILIEDPTSFIKDIANVYLRDLQSKGKKVPILQRRNENGKVVVRTSHEA